MARRPIPDAEWPAILESIIVDVTGVFASVEERLVHTVARELRAVDLSENQARLDSLARLRLAGEDAAREVREETGPLAEKVISRALASGESFAEAWVRGLLGEVPGTHLVHGALATGLLVQDLHNRFDDVTKRILRWPEDVYRDVISRTTPGLLLGMDTGRQAQARAWRELRRRGVTGFVDRADRRWNLATYVEMATRTASHRAFTDSNLATLGSFGIDLVTAVGGKGQCEACGRWVGQVMSQTGSGARTIEVEHAYRDGVFVTVRVKGSVDDAIADGFLHPNAVLGDQPITMHGAVESAVRSRYNGPAYRITTRSGRSFTVSPNHPVLTGRGWLPAQGVCEGDEMVRTGFGEATGPAANVELDHMPSGTAEMFDALATRGVLSRVAVAGDDLHGDAVWCEREVDVVVPHDGLLVEVDAPFAEHGCEHDLVLPDVQSSLVAGLCAGGLAGDGVDGAAPVLGSLADRDPVGLEPSADGRIGDVVDAGEVLARHPGLVVADEVVGVERDWFHGWAYDFQTSERAYSLDSLLIHNCRHTLVGYFPGLNNDTGEPWTREAEDAQAGLRALEVEVRKAKRDLAGALNDDEAKAAKRRVRDMQARIREHIKETGEPRRREREQLNYGHRTGAR